MTISENLDTLLPQESTVAEKCLASILGAEAGCHPIRCDPRQTDTVVVKQTRS
jgi:hypothetical protein